MTEATKDTAKAYKLALERFNIAERERYGSNGAMERSIGYQWYAFRLWLCKLIMGYEADASM